jgi:hypothetical protein
MARVHDNQCAREALVALEVHGRSAARYGASMKLSTPRESSWRFSHVARRRASGPTLASDGWTRRVLVLDIRQPRHFLTAQPPAQFEAARSW